MAWQEEGIEKGSFRAQSWLSEEMFDTCFFYSDQCSCLDLLKESTCKKKEIVWWGLLHNMDGSTSAMLFLLRGVIKNEIIIHFPKRSLQCKVTVLINLAV